MPRTLAHFGRLVSLSLLTILACGTPESSSTTPETDGVQTGGDVQTDVQTGGDITQPPNPCTAEARAAAQQRTDSEYTELTYCQCAMWNVFGMQRDPHEIESQECARPRPSVCDAYDPQTDPNRCPTPP